jgi:AGZA family xanthine/uracil permease-like MFS transporter
MSDTDDPAATSTRSGPLAALASFFGLEAHGTDLRTEAMAGATIFLTMSYVVVVIPSLLAPAIDLPGYTEGQVVQMLAVITIVVTVIGTALMAVVANRPFAQAPGLGLVAFFTFTVVLTLGVPWQTALAAVFVEGLIFTGLSAFGARKYIVTVFPEPVKLSVGTGIGLFLGIIGLQNMGVVVADQSTLVALGPIASDPVALIATIGLLITFGLQAAGVRGSIVYGIIATTLIGYGVTLAGIVPADAGLTVSVPAPNYDVTPIVGAALNGFAGMEVFTFALIVFTFFFVDFFDTAGTITGVGQMAGFLDADGNLPEMEKPLMANAIATTIGGLLGTSTVSTYIDSATGVEEGGRTGLTALVTAGLFLVTLVFVPLAAAIPQYASNIALVVVAILMLGNVTDIDWNDITHSIPAGMTIIIMPLTYSIAYGLAAGIITFPLVKSLRDGPRTVRPGQWVLAGAFLLYFYVRTSGMLTGQF